MEKKFGFTLLTPAEFERWIPQQDVARTVLYIQEHHTWSPSYQHFTGSNHFDLQKGMQNFHKNVNGWLDIGQHFSIFPDGKIATGRNLELSPACIYGFNSHSICIENVGNFDVGGDVLRPEHREAIVRVTAALCRRFRVPVNPDHIVYHHWFDLRTGARTDGSGMTKTCPGTTFFGGNTVADAVRNFLPLVQNVVDGKPITPLPGSPIKYGYVTADWLNVRQRPSANSRRMNVTPVGSILRVYEVYNGWYRISATKQEWVSGRYVKDVRRAAVRASVLNVRSGPGVRFDIMGTVKKDDEVFLYEENGNWGKISLDERWVSTSYLTFE